MSFSPGQIITAQRLNRLQPATYRAVASALLTGIVTNSDISGTEIPFTTETDNATIEATWFADARNLGSGTFNTQVATSAYLDGATTSDVFGLYQSNTLSEKATVGNQWTVDVPTAGAHTIKLRATIPGNGSQVNVYTNLALRVYENV